MIPKRIHYCWFGGKEKPALERQCLASWRRFLPDYEMVEWNEANFDVRANDFVRRCLEQKQWAFLADYARLWAVHRLGGVYLDTDVEVIKSFDGFLGHAAFLGFEKEGDDGQMLVNAAVLGATPGHPVVKAFLDCYVDGEVYDDNGRVKPIPAGVVTPVLRSLGLKNPGRQEVHGVMIYERSVFYPFYYNERFTPECIKDQTHAIHWWQGSWRGQRRSLKPTWLGSVKRRAQAAVKSLLGMVGLRKAG